MSLTESQIIQNIQDVLKPVIATGAHDLLDDGAELPICPEGHTRVITQDASAEHSDFKLGWGPVESAGWRAIVQNLSDLASMGAKPVGFLWSLEVPKYFLENNAELLQNYCQGALKACQTYGLEFYGGDLSFSNNHFSACITAFGDVAGKPLKRQDAKLGEKLYVSKALGASNAGLKELMAGKRESDLIKAHLWPTPELELSQKLIGHASACMDISDGLAKDLHRLCKASGLGATLTNIPIAQGASLEDALSGGEDYALLFSAKDSQFGIEIGEPNNSGEITLQSKTGSKKLEPVGFDHFNFS